MSQHKDSDEGIYLYYLDHEYISLFLQCSPPSVPLDGDNDAIPQLNIFKESDDGMLCTGA